MVDLNVYVECRSDLIRMSEIGGSSCNMRQSPYLTSIHQIRIKKLLIAKNPGNGSTQLKKKSNHETWELVEPLKIKTLKINGYLK